MSWRFEFCTEYINKGSINVKFILFKVLIHLKFIVRSNKNLELKRRLEISCDTLRSMCLLKYNSAEYRYVTSTSNAWTRVLRSQALSVECAKRMGGRCGACFFVCLMPDV